MGIIIQMKPQIKILRNFEIWNSEISNFQIVMSKEIQLKINLTWINSDQHKITTLMTHQL